MNNLFYDLRVWYRLTLNSFFVVFVSRFGAVIFLLGKILRFVFFFLFLSLLLSRTKVLGTYNYYQVFFFYLTFNFIDSLSQILFREVYRFRFMVVEGRFDYTLLQPFNSLLRSLAGGADLLDLILLIPIILMMIIIGWKIPGINSLNILLYFLLLINSMIVVTSLHILVLSVGILTTTVDHAIMIYRDIASMGRLPVDIYREPLRSLITFIIPVGIIMTFPAKVIMGLLSIPFVIFSLLAGIIFLAGSLRLWKYSLTKYSSASS